MRFMINLEYYCGFLWRVAIELLSVQIILKILLYNLSMSQIDYYFIIHVKINFQRPSKK